MSKTIQKRHQNLTTYLGNKLIKKMSKCTRAYFKVAWKNDTQKVQQQEQYTACRRLLK